ncbi:dihydroorotate dehydrogenase, type 2 [Gammaproteobacteria bacterium]
MREQMLLHSYSFARNLLFRIDPEAAHDFVLSNLSQFHKFGLLKFLMPKRVECPREVMGLRFPNPVGLAAGLDKDGEHLEALATFGFGFIEVGTVTPRPQFGNPRPRMFRLPAAEALINRMGFNNQGVEALVNRLKKIHFDGVLGINIGKNRDTPIEQAAEDYCICLRQVYPYAGYVAINLSSPNTPNLRRLQNVDELSKLLAILRADQIRLSKEYGRVVPLAVKIAPDLSPTEIEEIANVILKEGTADGIIATNTSVAREGVAHLSHASEVGGLSGAPIAERATSIVSQLRAVVGDRIPIIGAGGILTAEDARAKQAAGAALVQIYTGLIYRGPALIPEAARVLCCCE